VVHSDDIDEAETPRLACRHPFHDRPREAGFWYQDPLSLDAFYRPLAAGTVKSPMPVHIRDLGIEAPSGHLVTGHIIATDPRGQSLLPKRASPMASLVELEKGEVVVYRVIRGTAEFKDAAGKGFELATGDSVTVGKSSATLVAVGENTQLLRLGLLKNMDKLSRWTPAQRDEIDGLAGQIITRKDPRPQRTQGKPVGYLYE
jgi:hypothetical protein